MKWLRTIIVFDKEDIRHNPDWKIFHEGYVRAICQIVHPESSDKLTVRRRQKIGKNSFKRNGVQFLKKSFLDKMVAGGWIAEGQVNLKEKEISVKLMTYPDLQDYHEEITSGFGGFDFVSHSDDQKVAVEWETGNISSSHRSLNKLCIALNAGKIDIGVLVVPSRSLYTHLTDRIGNIGELSPYLSMWNMWGDRVVKRGLLAVTVVEHDELTDDENVPYFAVGKDGRYQEGQDGLQAGK